MVYYVLQTFQTQAVSYIIYFENMLQILVSLYKTVTCGHNYNSVLVIPFQYYM